MTVTVVEAVIVEEVVSVNVALVEPAATVTLAGTEQMPELLLESATVVFEEDAVFSITVP